MNGSNIIAGGDTLYSYGRHFPLAIAVRDKRGAVTHFVLNADRVSNTTSQHQSTARSLCQRIARELGDVPVILLPFSALESAGVSPTELEPIHVRPDRMETRHHSSAVAPGDRHVPMDDPDGRTVIEDGWRWDGSRHTHGPHEVPLRVPDPDRVYVGRSNWLTAERDADGTWRWTTQRHWLGDSLFRARLREMVSVKPNPEQAAAFAEAGRLLREHEELDDHARRENYLSRGHGYARNGYEVPRSHEMVEALQTRAEAMWEEYRLAQERFAALIPKGHSYRGTLHITRQRTRHAYFLSSFDYQEARPLYFLCELPASARPRTVEEAIDCLKPPEVVAAEARGLRVTRQGDLFAIPTKLGKRQLRAMRGRGRDFTKRLRVLGTNHSVTEGVMCRGGAVLGRGVMRHEPDAWRTPDHARQRMGDGRQWHLLVRNTVPRVGA